MIDSAHENVEESLLDTHGRYALCGGILAAWCCAATCADHRVREQYQLRCLGDAAVASRLRQRRQCTIHSLPLGASEHDKHRGDTIAGHLSRSALSRLC